MITCTAVREETGPDGPAVGVHWTDGRTVGLIPYRAGLRPGACLLCGERQQITMPRLPTCAPCARLLWGDEHAPRVGGVQMSIVSTSPSPAAARHPRGGLRSSGQPALAARGWDSGMSEVR